MGERAVARPGKNFDELSRAGLFVEEALGAVPAQQRLARLRKQPLLISLAPRMGKRGQLMLANVANIAGRLFEYLGPIDLDVPDEEVMPGVFGLQRRARLPEATAQLLRKLRMEPDQADVSTRRRHKRYRRGIAIGGTRRTGVLEPVFLDSAEWVAAVSPSPVRLPNRRREVFNPFGALVASALGTAELAKSFFRFLTGDADAERFEPLAAPLLWDLWSHDTGGPSFGPPLPRELYLGGVGVAGLGALGAAAIVAFSQLQDADGWFELVDDDTLTPTNLERVLTALGEHVGQSKAILARRALRFTTLRSRIIRGRYERELPRAARAATLLVGVDSGEARRYINQYLPEAIYNGGTQGSEIIVSRHVRFDGACLECLYPQTDDPIGAIARRLGVDRDTAAALRSGERKLDSEVLSALLRRGGVEFLDVDVSSLQGEPLERLFGYECSRSVVIQDLPEATIGFVSALGGFLMACELVKDRVQPERALPLDARRPVYRLDLLRGLPTADCVEAYVPRRDCFCQQPETKARIAALRGGPA